MDEISFGKARIILLPVLLGLVIIFFSKLFSIKVSLLVWIVLLIVIALISLLLSMRLRTSLTSKIPTQNTKTIFYGLLWLVGIIFFLLLIWECFTYINCLGPEKFSDDTTMKDYGYNGNSVIQDGALKTRGNVTVFNSDASDEFFGIPLYWEHPDFDIFGTGKGTIRVVMDNGIQKKYQKEVSINGSFKVDFGTGSDYEREDIVYFKVNDVSSTIDKPPKYFDTDRPYSVKVYFNGTFNVFEIGIGE